MGRGRPQKPATQKMKERTYRPDRDGVTPVASGKVAKPDDLGEYGSAHWDNIYGFIVGVAGGGTCDSETLAECCRMYQRFKTLIAIADAGDIEQTSGKRAFDAAMRAHDTWARQAGKFGLTPSDRASIKQQVDDDVDPLDVMLSDAPTLKLAGG